ncbi:hypothetical protein QJQ45_018338 [Haematococcus lacustris]|nr:hypothetical protein QJQ45_018338 [Haematococcus lacustris]
MDLITKLPSASHGFDAICVFVDRLSKMVHFVPCKESMNAKGFARLFVDNVFKLHGLPKDMVSDRGPHFHNTFWHHVQKLLGMRGSLSSSYHPQSDGQTERYNRVLEEMLRHYISPTQADWPDYLSLAEFAVNNSWQESIKSTPFLVNTGQSPITPMLHSLPDKGRCPEGLSYATWWQEAVAKAKLCMQAAQQRQAAYANQDRREVHYKVGQMVLLSTKNMRLKPGKARKLLPRFVGPFKVLGLVGQVAVNLQLPASMSRLHSVFHVSLIKPYTGTDVGFMPPPVEWLDEEPVYYVERLLDHRHVHAGKAKEYLVQWEGYDAHHNTWEPRSNLVGCDKILAEYNAAHNLNLALDLQRLELACAFLLTDRLWAVAMADLAQLAVRQQGEGGWEVPLAMAGRMRKRFRSTAAKIPNSRVAAVVSSLMQALVAAGEARCLRLHQQLGAACNVTSQANGVTAAEQVSPMQAGAASGGGLGAEAGARAGAGVWGAGQAQTPSPDAANTSSPAAAAAAEPAQGASGAAGAVTGAGAAGAGAAAEPVLSQPTAVPQHTGGAPDAAATQAVKQSSSPEPGATLQQ